MSGSEYRRNTNVSTEAQRLLDEREDTIYKLREENIKLKSDVTGRSEEVKHMKAMLQREKSIGPRDIDYTFEISKLKRQLEVHKNKIEILRCSENTKPKKIKSKPKKPSIVRMGAGRASIRPSSARPATSASVRSRSSKAKALKERNTASSSGMWEKSDISSRSDKDGGNGGKEDVSEILTALKSHIISTDNDMKAITEENNRMRKRSEDNFRYFELDSKLSHVMDEISKISAQFGNQLANQMEISDGDEYQFGKQQLHAANLLRKEHEELKTKYRELIEKTQAASVTIEKYKEEFISLKENYRECEMRLLEEMREKEELLDLLEEYKIVQGMDRNHIDDKSGECSCQTSSDMAEEILKLKEEKCMLKGEIVTLLHMVNRNDIPDTDFKDAEPKTEAAECVEINENVQYEEAELTDLANGDDFMSEKNMIRYSSESQELGSKQSPRSPETVQSEGKMTVLSLDFVMVNLFEQNEQAGDGNPIDNFFFYIDFFQSETQVSPILSSNERSCDFSLSYEVDLSDFFFDTIYESGTDVVFCRCTSMGAEYSTFAVCHIRMDNLLAAAMKGSVSFAQMFPICEIDREEEVIGNMQVTFEFNRDVGPEIVSYHRRNDA